MPHRRKSQQAEREYEKIKSQLEGLEESVRDRCKKEFTGGAVPLPRQVEPQSIPGSSRPPLRARNCRRARVKSSRSRWPGVASPRLASPSQA